MTPDEKHVLQFAWGAIMRRALILIGLVNFAAPAVADDEMALQRCVWMCLANSKGNSDPAYSACVEKYCAEESSDATAGTGRKDAKKNKKEKKE